MAHRKADKAALRRERERREAEARAAQERKRIVGYGAAGAIAIAAIAVVVLLAAGGGDSSGGQGGGDVFPEGGEVAEQTQFDPAAAAKAAGCELKSNPGRARTHTTSLDDKVPYKENPPNSGRHFQTPAEDGLYYEAPPDEMVVHAQEHGRVVVWVKPSLPAEARKTIRALFDEDEYQMLVVPRANMPYAVAATAWSRDPQPNGTGRTLGCDRWNDKIVDAIRTFRDEHRSNGPEAIP
jgi:hypothetical protein